VASNADQITTETFFSRDLAEDGREYLSAGFPWLTFLVMRAADSRTTVVCLWGDAELSPNLGDAKGQAAAV
jgi:hypothetical protein